MLHTVQKCFIFYTKRVIVKILRKKKGCMNGFVEKWNVMNARENVYLVYFVL